MEIDELIREYSVLEVHKQTQEKLRYEDPEVLMLTEQLGKLQGEESLLKQELQQKEDPYVKSLDVATERQDAIKTAISERWTEWGIVGKTHKSPFGTATLRVTKSLIVESKEKIVEILVKTNQIVEGVSKFNLRLLRTLKDAHLVPDEAARYEEHKSVTIKLGGEE